MTEGPFGFPAEDLLAEHPPDYQRERILLTAKLVAIFIFFIVLVPVMMATPVEPEKPTEEPSKEVPDAKTKTRKKSKAKQQQPVIPESPKDGDDDDDEIIIYEAHPLVSFLSVFGFMFFTVFILATHNPDNYYAANGVFQAPLFSPAECQDILNMADAAAQVNYEKARSVHAMYELTGRDANETGTGLLEDPKGWQKLRHGSYPTTDLNLVTDPFTKENHDYLKQKLDARLSPIIQRIYGIPPAAVRAYDVSFFPRRYETQVESVVHSGLTDIFYISTSSYL
jgi:cytoskeletal protein RodZ